MDASTTKSLPRYFAMDFPLAGDSTITSDLLLASLQFRLLSVPAADLPVRLVLTTLLFRWRGNMLHRSPAISERYSIFPTMGSRPEKSRRLTRPGLSVTQRPFGHLRIVPRP